MYTKFLSEDQKRRYHLEELRS